MAEQEIPPTSQLQAVPGMPLRDSRDMLNDMLVGLGFALFVLALYLLPSQWRALSETSEARIAVTARNMIKSGNWVVPEINGKPRLNKPPLPYWLVAYTAQILGPDAEENRLVSVRAAVLPSALLGAACIFLIILFGSHMHGRSTGLLAGAILGLSFLMVRYSQYGTGEIALTFFTGAAVFSAAWLACSPKPGILSALLLGLSLGLAILTKWHVPVLIVFGGLLVESIRCRAFNPRKVICFLVALLIAAGVAAPWCVAVSSRQPEAASVMSGEIWDLFKVASHDQSDWPIYYFYKALEAFLPWTPILLIAVPSAIYRARKSKANRTAMEIVPQRFVGFYTYTALLSFAVLCLVGKQQQHYLLPLLPPTALAIGAALSRLNQPGGFAEERIGWAQITLGVLSGIGIAVLPLFFEEIAFEVAIPLAGLTLALSLAAARQWVEGHPSTAGLALGLMAYALLAGWTMFISLNNPKHDTFVKESREHREFLSNQPSNAKLYSMRTSLPNSIIQYYLDCDRIHQVKELYENEGQRQPQGENEEAPRLLICDRDLAMKLGQPGKGDYRILYLTPEIQHRLKAFRVGVDKAGN